MKFMEQLRGAVGPLYEGEGMGAGAGADAGGAGGDPGSGWAPPEGVPEAFRGADANETLTKLLGGFNEVNTRAEGLRTKLAGLPKAPDSPDAYTYEPGDKLKPFFGGDMAKDPVMSAARDAFHKAGVPQEQFSAIIENVFTPLVEQGLIAAPIAPETELTNFSKLHSLDRNGTLETLSNNEAFAKGLSGQLAAQLGNLPDEHKAEVNALMLSLTDSAAGNTLLKALSGRLAENGIRIAGNGQDAGGAFSETDLKKMAGDPRLDPANRDHADPAKRFDADLRKRYDDAYAALKPKATAF